MTNQTRQQTAERVDLHNKKMKNSDRNLFTVESRKTRWLDLTTQSNSRCRVWWVKYLAPGTEYVSYSTRRLSLLCRQSQSSCCSYILRTYVYWSLSIRLRTASFYHYFVLYFVCLVLACRASRVSPLATRHSPPTQTDSNLLKLYNTRCTQIIKDEIYYS